MAGSAGASAIPRDDRGDDAPRPAGKTGFGDALRAVAWAFLGIRKRGSFERDVHLSPVHVVVVGLLLAAVFVGLLVTIARFAAG